MITGRADKGLEFGGLSLEPFPIPQQEGQFDLSLEMAEGGESLFGAFKYNTDLFNFGTIARMADHFQLLLTGIVDNPEKRLSDLPLLRKTECHQLLVEFNDTQMDYPKDKCLNQLFEAQVEQTPDNVAIVFEGNKMTYKELNRHANRVAHHLRSLGVGADTLVGICVERSFEMVIGLLGILKAGGAYVPLDPAYPAKRLAFMMEDAQTPVLLTQKRLVKDLPVQGARVVLLESLWSDTSQENPACETTADNLAYVIYTSGSTGKPKGVLITHHTICNHMLWRQQKYPLTEHDRFLHKASLSFDISVWEIFAPLQAGGQLILCRPGGQMDSGYLTQLVVEQEITAIHFGPSMLQVFLEEKELGKCTSLKHVFCGGEPLPVELKEKFFSRLNAELHHQYGPTETTVDVTMWDCEPQDDRQLVPIGHPIANTQIHILDTHLQPVPIGVRGELHVGGVSLARGYLNRPELTAEKFIANPFSEESESRLYKTGDLARYAPDGSIEFLGRLDYQVKIRGFRVELGEIETLLGQYPAVRDVIVLAREDAPGDKRLVAYLVVEEEPGPTTTELRSFLKQKLPDYMVPSAFVGLDGFPLTPNGKVDRRALPAPDKVRPQMEEAFVAPRTPTEELLAGIWAEILDVEQVGVKDNFFELGGHSLLSLQVIVRLEQKLGLRINPGEFVYQTLGQVAAVCESQMPNLIPTKPMSLLQKLFRWIKSAILPSASNLR